MAFRLRLFNPFFTSLKFNQLASFSSRKKSSNQNDIFWQSLTEPSKKSANKSNSESDWFNDLTGSTQKSANDNFDNVTSREKLSKASDNEKRVLMQRMIDIQVANDFSLPKDLTEEEWHFLEDKKSFGQIKKGLQ